MKTIEERIKDLEKRTNLFIWSFIILNGIEIGIFVLIALLFYLGGNSL